MLDRGGIGGLLSVLDGMTRQDSTVSEGLPADNKVPLAGGPAAGAQLTPAMRQYVQFKQQYPQYVLFFRMGDFYEMFWDDAILCSRVLGVALTARSKGENAIPMAGVPFHAVEGYLRRMLAAGHKVALCEQTEDAALAKGVVKREVTRLLTPGTLTDESYLDGRSDNYLAAVSEGMTSQSGQRTGLAWVDLSTGACLGMSGTRQEVLDELSRLRPVETLVAEDVTGAPGPLRQALRGYAVTQRPGWQFTAHQAQQEVRKQWGADRAAGFGFEQDDPALHGVAGILAYLQETQKVSVSHIQGLRRHRIEQYLLMDGGTWRSLEVDRTVRSGGTDGSLLSVVDKTRTAMGGRMLRNWLRYPLTDVEHIRSRQAAVAALVGSADVLKGLLAALDTVCDIERIAGRVAVGRCVPRDLAALGRCLLAVPELVAAAGRWLGAADVLSELIEAEEFCKRVGAHVSGAVVADPPAHLREGGVIATGFDAELDRLRRIGAESQKWLADYQGQLAAKSGITTLKVAFNRVFGYYIEVTDTHRAKVPVEWTRKQTVRNAERYITPELKKFEEEALTASERGIALEQHLFEQVRQYLLPQIGQLQELAGALARLDVLCGLAALAIERRYIRPTVVPDRVLDVVGGKHPVLEVQLGTRFVPNDVHFSEGDRLQLITGPNMAGKSTFIRQVALIVLLAQIGSFVPATSATIGVADRLFTRIGANDELHEGQSTFMVEMTETANILNNATDRSLVVLDEIGRGTSTLDGLSLAWAISEHLAGTVACRALMATHYHELTELGRRFTGVKNLNVAVREWQDQVVFLHQIVEGAADRSYGIHVARLAGVPLVVLERGRQLLGELSVQHTARPRISRSKRAEDSGQMELFVDPVTEVRRLLKSPDADGLSPEQLLATIRQLLQ